MLTHIRGKIIDILMISCAVFSIITASFTGFAENCEELPGSVIRLHILANSDSDSDQTLKYKLRDYIISYMDELMNESDGLYDAETLLREKIGEIEEKSREFIENESYGYGAEAEICEMYFTTRVYENITMPAGNYKALRIIIGEGKGKNWWCVIFPPLCLPACSEKNGDLYISEEMSKIIEENKGKTEYKFALYEWLCGIVPKK